MVVTHRSTSFQSTGLENALVLILYARMATLWWSCF